MQVEEELEATGLEESTDPHQTLLPAAPGTPPRQVRFANSRRDRVLVDLSAPIAGNSASMNGAEQTNPERKKDKKGRKKGRGKGKRQKDKGNRISPVVNARCLGARNV